MTTLRSIAIALLTAHVLAGCGDGGGNPAAVDGAPDSDGLAETAPPGAEAPDALPNPADAAEAPVAEAGPEAPPFDAGDGDAPPLPMVTKASTSAAGKTMVTTPGGERELYAASRSLNRPLQNASVEYARSGGGALVRVSKDGEGAEPTLLWLDDRGEAAAIDTERPDLRAQSRRMEIELRPSQHQSTDTLSALAGKLTNATHFVFLPPPATGVDTAQAKFAAYKAPLDGVYYLVPEAQKAQSFETRGGQSRVLPVRAAMRAGLLTRAGGGQTIGVAAAAPPAQACSRPARAAVLATADASAGKTRVSFSVEDPDGKHEGTLVGIDSVTPAKHLPKNATSVDLDVPPGQHFVCVRPVWLGGDKDVSLDCRSFTVAAGPARPDLEVIVDLETGATPTEGATTTVKIYVTNTGEADAGPFDVELGESRDGFAEHGDGQVRILHLEGVPARTTTPVERSSPWIPEVAGARFLVARVDAGDDVQESNEDNNRSMKAIAVAARTAPNGRPAVTIAGAPARARSGSLLVLQATAIDPEDGDVSGNIVWRSSRDGVIGTGAELRTGTLSIGRHRVFAEATDNSSEKRQGRAEVELDVYLDVTANSPPLATAGPRRQTSVGQPATVRATVRDPDGDSATAVWTIVSKPAGSSATPVLSADPKTVSLTPDVAGTYELALRATDGSVDDRDRLVITAVPANSPPAISALVALPATVKFGTTVQLDATATDPDGDPLTPNWRLFRPTGSQAVLAGFDSISPGPIFRPDIVGTYKIRLTVDDGRGGSAEREVTVVANDGKPQPVYTKMSSGTIAANDASLDGSDIEVDGGTVIIDGTHTFRFLRVGPTGVLRHAPATSSTEGKLDLTITYRFEVVPGGKVDLAGLGYLGGNKPNNTGNPGRTEDNQTGPDRAVGGSHGGRGGASVDVATPAAESAVLYGDLRDPRKPGGGGGGRTSGGGSGGGALHVVAAEALIDGVIDASGEGHASGAGAGGAVYIQVSETLRGSGRIRVRGGSSSTGSGGAGGGGRIALVGWVRAGSTVDHIGLEAQGGGASPGGDSDRHGGVGTIFLKAADDPNGTLILDQSGILATRAASASQETTISGGAIDLVVVRGNVRASLGAVNATSLELTGGSTRLDTLALSGDLVLDGATLEASSVTAASVRLLGTAVLTHPRSTATSTGSLTVTATSVEIGPLARIDAAGRGYLGGNTPANLGVGARSTGNVVTPSSPRAVGGSHGGPGGISATPLGTGTDSAPTYDDHADPREPGGGGGSANASPAGGSGGGVVKLVVTDLIVNGTIDASGETSSSGGGAGGTVRVVMTGKLSGAGLVRARGGDASSYGSGGGGRIAVTGHDAGTSDLGQLRFDVAGGFSTTSNTSGALDRNGACGTVFLESASDAKGTMLLANGGVDTNQHRTTLPPGQSFDWVAVSGGAHLALGNGTATHYALGDGALDIDAISVAGGLELDGTVLETSSVTVTSGTLALRNGALLTHPFTGANAGTKSSLVVDAPAVTVDSASAIDVSGRGYLAGNAPGNSGNPARGVGNQSVAFAWNAGGSHGGRGGAAGSPASAANSPAAVYDDLVSVDDVGTGGGGSAGNGLGNGGGLIKITATDLALDGLIAADGSTSSSGGGAGGGIRIVLGGNLTGSGRIQAVGGSSASYGAGGGGRIAITGYDPAATLTLTISAAGGVYTGSDDDRNGSAGTVWLKSKTDGKGRLILDNAGRHTVSLETDIAATQDLDLLVVRGGAATGLGPSTAASYVIDSRGYLRVDAVAQTGDLTIDGAVLETGAVTLGGAATLRLTGSAVLRQLQTTSVTTPRSLLITATNVDIGPLAVVDGLGRGYLGGNWRGNGQPAQTKGGSAPNRNIGGSHGGRGGASANPVSLSNASALAYGDFRAPADGGGGGGSLSASNGGGNGGGAIRITATDVTLNGVIDASGVSDSDGGGAGGSVHLVLAGSLTGTGAIRASGGSSGSYGAGGGGRIAIVGYLAAGSTLATIQLGAFPGSYTTTAHDQNGAAGTIFVRSSTQANGELLVDAGGVRTAGVLTPVLAASDLTLDRLEVRGGAQVCSDGVFTATLRQIETGSAVQESQSGCGS